VWSQKARRGDFAFLVAPFSVGVLFYFLIF
jgi:hypothetical protein